MKIPGLDNETLEYMNRVTNEARSIWIETFTTSRDNSVTPESLNNAVKLANKAADAYLKKWKKLPIEIWNISEISE